MVWRATSSGTTLNANDFQQPAGTAAPALPLRHLEYNIGGPVMLPGGLRQVKDKMFFSGAGFWPLSAPTALTQRTTATALERRELLAESGREQRLIAVRDPFANCAPFAGNIIPAAARFQRPRPAETPAAAEFHRSRRLAWNYKFVSGCRRSAQAPTR
jgi:hypothetical protein